MHCDPLLAISLLQTVVGFVNLSRDSTGKMHQLEAYLPLALLPLFAQQSHNLTIRQITYSWCINNIDRILA